LDLCSEGSSLGSSCCIAYVVHNVSLCDIQMPVGERLRVYLGRYPKHLGMLPVKKLYEKSATFNPDARHRPVKFVFEA